MGCFSWMFADTDNRKRLRCDRKGYVALPHGGFILERCYDGYGIFDGHDIYDLVVDWNKEFLTTDLLKKPRRSDYMSGEDGDRRYRHWLADYEKSCGAMKDFISGVPEDEITKKYGSEWKRWLGIQIACYDEENAALRYPIKICRTRPKDYDSLPASKSDPNQGCF